jgi:hypothetical protein
LGGAWNDDFLDECEQFSRDEREYEHDDQVDAACGAFNCVTKRSLSNSHACRGGDTSARTVIGTTMSCLESQLAAVASERSEAVGEEPMTKRAS